MATQPNDSPVTKGFPSTPFDQWSRPQRLAYWIMSRFRYVSECQRQTGIPRSSLERYLDEDGSDPTASTLQTFHSFGLNVHWYLTGHGSPQFSAAEVPSLSREEIIELQRYLHDASESLSFAITRIDHIHS